MKKKRCPNHSMLEDDHKHIVTNCIVLFQRQYNAKKFSLSADRKYVLMEYNRKQVNIEVGNIPFHPPFLFFYFVPSYVPFFDQ